MYYIEYCFDNFHPSLDFKLDLRNGTCFKFMDCIIKYYNTSDGQTLFFEYDNLPNSTYDIVDQKINFSIQLLSFLFSAPFYERAIGPSESSSEMDVPNNLMARNKLKRLLYIEGKIRKFKANYNFFLECLDLINTANNNNFSENNYYEDAFLYYFKVVEKICKKYFVIYSERKLTKAKTKNNKIALKEILKNYSYEYLGLQITNDMYNTKTDLFYKYLKKEFYGNIFSKVSLFNQQKKLNIGIETINKLVKLRNKLAHGDYYEQDISTEVGNCELLAVECFSIYFFNKHYREIHLSSRREENEKDFWLSD